jgi:hypothetical protein
MHDRMSSLLRSMRSSDTPSQAYVQLDKRKLENKTKAIKEMCTSVDDTKNEENKWPSRLRTYRLPMRQIQQRRTRE